MIIVTILAAALIIALFMLFMKLIDDRGAIGLVIVLLIIMIGFYLFRIYFWGA